MGKRMSSLAKQKLSDIFGNMQANPPSILAKTAAKKGDSAANKQKIAIALNKARDAGVNIPKKSQKPSKTASKPFKKPSFHKTSKKY